MHLITGRLRLLVRIGVLGTVLAGFAATTRAADPPQQKGSDSNEASASDQTSAELPAAEVPATDLATDSKNRIFGMVPNYTTVEGFGKVEPITAAKSFKMAALDSFDPFVYPLFGFVAAVSQVQHQPPSWDRDWPGYAKRYGLAFADNTICSLVTTGLMPSLLKQDPRYYQGRATGFFPRLAYAASRSVVTKTRSGQPQFNYSEIGGTLVVASVSNLYYPAEERNVRDTMERWGSQAMWDTVANELKEFWPDIRKKLRRL